MCVCVCVYPSIEAWTYVWVCSVCVCVAIGILHVNHSSTSSCLSGDGQINLSCDLILKFHCHTF